MNNWFLVQILGMDEIPILKNVTKEKAEAEKERLLAKPENRRKDYRVFQLPKS